MLKSPRGASREIHHTPWYPGSRGREESQHVEDQLNRKNHVLKPLAWAIVGASLGIAGQALAADSAYWQSAEGKVWKDGSGKCWCAGYWTPAMATEECHPELVKKPEPPAPAAAPTPPPAPVAAPAPPPPPKKCDFTATLQNDGLFVFDQAVLTPAAKAKLDSDVVAKLQSCAKVDLVLIGGHTDRLGTQQYNQRLSERRASVVKDYLVSKGVVAGSMETNGFGKTQPVSGVTCDDKLPRKKLIECLAPHRRAVIEVQGPAK